MNNPFHPSHLLLLLHLFQVFLHQATYETFVDRDPNAQVITLETIICELVFEMWRKETPYCLENGPKISYKMSTMKKIAHSKMTSKPQGPPFNLGQEGESEDLRTQGNRWTIGPLLTKKNCQYFQLCTLVSLSLLFVLRYFPNALLARVPQLSYDNLDYDGEPGIEFGPRRTVE